MNYVWTRSQSGMFFDLRDELDRLVAYVAAFEDDGFYRKAYSSGIYRLPEGLSLEEKKRYIESIIKLESKNG